MTDEIKIKTQLIISDLKVTGLENISHRIFVKVRQDRRRKIKTDTVLPSDNSAVFEGEYIIPCKIMKNRIKSRGNKYILNFFVRSSISNDKYNSIGFIDIDLCNIYYCDLQDFDLKLKKCNLDAYIHFNIKFEDKIKYKYDEIPDKTNVNLFADLQFLKLTEDKLSELEKEVDMVISEAKN